MCIVFQKINCKTEQLQHTKHFLFKWNPKKKTYIYNRNRKKEIKIKKRNELKNCRREGKML